VGLDPRLIALHGDQPMPTPAVVAPTALKKKRAKVERLCLVLSLKVMHFNASRFGQPCDKCACSFLQA